MKRLSSFTVILIFIVLSIVGAAVVPLLDIQYVPDMKGSSLSVYYYWRGASAKVIEKDVTSIIEGLASSIPGTGEITSVSEKGNGYVSVEVKDKKNIEPVRYELASQIRRVYDKLPSGVSYPVISASSSGTDTNPILIYTINSDMPASGIERYARASIVDELSLIEGVGSVELSGTAQEYVELSYGPDVLSTLGITADGIQSAVSTALSGYSAVGTVDHTGVFLSPGTDTEDIGNIPIQMAGERIIRLSDVADIAVREKEPTDYYRINGLNTIMLIISPESGVNTVTLCNTVKERMSELSGYFPENFSAVVYYDSSDYLKKEIDKIVRRTVLSVLILLVFVFVTSLSFRYLSVIILSLISNLLVSFALYVLFGVHINIYSMAGITVSLGIIIDMSIVMISHYGYYRNRKVFISLLAAQATTIGALSVVYLLPDQTRLIFDDFASVVIINLVISLLVSMLLIPALSDSFGMTADAGRRSLRRRRRTVRFNRRYTRYIRFARRYRWVVALLTVLLFGIPIGQLPDKLGSEAGNRRNRAQTDVQDTFWTKVYNVTLGSDFFLDNLKRPLSSILGGCISIFLENNTYDFYYRDVQRPQLIIRASLPEGCTVGQLNEIVRYMENFLSGFDEIEMFTTTIDSYDMASIRVSFREDAEKSMFPSLLKNRVIDKASDYGGANWSVYGINDRYFNNNVSVSDNPFQRIRITGYNYDNLYAYCLDCVESLSKVGRVRNIGVFGHEDGSYGISSGNEYFIGYDRDALAAYGLSPADAYASLSSRLGSYGVGSCMVNGVLTDVVLTSADRKRYDVWNLRNEHIDIGSENRLFSEIGSIEKRRSGNDIYKKNRQYSLLVCYDYAGNARQADKVIGTEVNRLNTTVLPVGYKAEEFSYSGSHKEKGRNLLLLLTVIAIIYFVCAVLFESLRYPLIIIGLIPISFIGLFLAFILTGCHFDQGGFAALVMLSGLTVNAGIYIISEYNLQLGRRNGSFIRAFNHKIEPTLLTILSTVLGLIPFLMDGPDEVFWFTFALGTMGGLIFSITALVFYLPVWIPERITSFPVR